MQSTVSGDTSFTPRKEFIPESPHMANAFALLTLSGSSGLRLYSFPLPLISALKRMFNQLKIIFAFREDVTLNCAEFTLDGKLWANPKSINTERFLVDIMAVIYQHGWIFLSTIDYGRESDDRLAIAFSKPTSLILSPQRSATPQDRADAKSPEPTLPTVLGGHGTMMSDMNNPTRVPFAISFPAATMLRVISPPLHLTPAILQAVRGSWPRGVQSEKKIGESCYEFKLKGYKWFQEDTFATDSLQHILGLLSSLDAHQFALLTSLTVTSRSRVKDLWIFTGPGPTTVPSVDLPDSPDSSIGAIPSATNLDLKRSGSNEIARAAIAGGIPSQHRKYATAPGAAQLPPPPPQHPVERQINPPVATVRARAATDETGHYAPPSSFVPVSPPQHPTQQQNVLRKPPPRAQVPVSAVAEESAPAAEQDQWRVTMPSTVGSVENMTGVGAGRGERSETPDVIYSTAPPVQSRAADYRDEILATGASAAAVHSTTRSRSRSPPGRVGSPTARPASPRTRTPPLIASHSPSPRSTPVQPATPPTPTEAASATPPPTTRPSGPHPTPSNPLLGAGVFAADKFRDSSFSTSTESTTPSREIPIKWVGGAEVVEEADESMDKSETSAVTEKASSEERPKMAERMSTEPFFPGGWQATPAEEKPELVQEPAQTTDGGEPLQAVDARVQSPELVHSPESRKSEVGVVGVVTPTEPMPEAKRAQTGQGWVLVNVEGKTATEEAKSSPATEPQVSEAAANDSRGAPATAADSNNAQGGERTATPTGGMEASTAMPSVAKESSMNAAAKAIAVIDAVDAQEKAKGKGKEKSSDSGGSGSFKRFFSLKRRSSSDSGSPASESETATDSRPRAKSASKTGSSFRDRLKKKGVSESKIAEEGADPAPV